MSENLARSRSKKHKQYRPFILLFNKISKRKSILSSSMINAESVGINGI